VRSFEGHRRPSWAAGNRKLETKKTEFFMREFFVAVLECVVIAALFALVIAAKCLLDPL